MTAKCTEGFERHVLKFKSASAEVYVVKVLQGVVSERGSKGLLAETIPESEQGVDVKKVVRHVCYVLLRQSGARAPGAKRYAQTRHTHTHVGRSSPTLRTVSRGGETVVMDTLTIKFSDSNEVGERWTEIQCQMNLRLGKQSLK